MDTQSIDGRHLHYPVHPISAQEAHGELLYAYGRMFARGPDGHWHVVETEDGRTDD